MIAGIVEQDSSYGTKVAGLSWVIDGIDWEELRVLEIWAETFNEDQELARSIVSPDFRPYLSNPGLESVSRVAEYEWPADGLNANEMRALIGIMRIAKHDHELASSLLDFSWPSDGITFAESRLLYSLSSLIPHRTGILEHLLEYQWLADGVSETEALALAALVDLSRWDPELARQALNYEWVVDGFTWNEFVVLDELRYTSGRVQSYIRDPDSRPLELAGDLGWLADGLNANEIRAYAGIAEIGQLSPQIQAQLLGYSWIADGISQKESETIFALRNIVLNDVELAQEIVGMGLLDDPIRDSNGYALKSLGYPAITPDNLALLINQPWFADGLDEEEIAFIAIASGIRQFFSDSQYRSLLQTWSTQHTTVSLPLAGEVKVWVFVHGTFPNSDDALEMIEEAARALESLMGAPFPTNDVILWLIDRESFSGGYIGYHNGDHMALSTAIADRFTIYHETAHYYFFHGGNSPWFGEGGADFISYYTMDQVGFRSLETSLEILQSNTYCAEQGFENLQELVDYGESHYCNYHLGSLFLVSLFELLGEQVMSAALSELYLQPELKGRDITEEDFYLTFLKHTPLELRDEFRDLYRRIHGGPYPDILE